MNASSGRRGSARLIPGRTFVRSSCCSWLQTTAERRFTRIIVAASLIHATKCRDGNLQGVAGASRDRECVPGGAAGLGRGRSRGRPATGEVDPAASRIAPTEALVSPLQFLADCKRQQYLTGLKPALRNEPEPV